MKNVDDYAIVIGIDTYSRLFRLRSAHADASAFAKWLTSEDGGNLPEENILPIFIGPETPPLDLLNAQPAQRHIDNRLKMLGIENNQRIGRRLYFYFAGHGFGPEFDDVGILMIDATEIDINNNIGLREYRKFFQNHHIFDEVVYIIDCCRDDELDVRGLPGLRLNGPSFGILQDKRGEMRDYVLLAAPYGKKAYAVASEDKGQRQGLLTRALLQGLKEAHDETGLVTSDTLSKFIRKRVAELVNDPGVDPKLKEQKPQVLYLPDPPIVFSTLPPDPKPKLKVHIIAGPGQNGQLVLYNGDGEEMGRCNAEQATAEHPWEVELLRDAFVYVVEHVPSREQIPILPQSVTTEPHVVRFNGA